MRPPLRAAFLVLLACATLAQPGAAGADPVGPQEGARLSFAGAPVEAAAREDGPSGWRAFEAEVLSVEDGAVTFRFDAQGLLGGVTATRTYDLETRRSATEASWSVLWVGAEDVARGMAMLGEEPGVLVASTLAFHHFRAGSTDYYYDAATLLLVRAVDVGDGTVALRAR